jgi:hypothetical protein
MPDRYVSWVSATWHPQALPTSVVHEQDKAPVNTGLLDALGRPLYRVPETVPMGFHAPPPPSQARPKIT